MEAKLATNDAELQETHKKVSRDRHEEQLLQQHVADLNTRAEQMKASHIEALQAVRMRDPRNLERAKADTDHSQKAEINRRSRQLAIHERSNTPMSANRKGVSMMIVVNVYLNLY